MPRNEFRTIDLPIADELAKRSGTRPRVRPQECAPFAVAGAVPKLVLSPRTLTEASKTLATLAAEGASISIRGSGSKQWRPPHPYDIDVVLSAARFDGVLEHAPADLTVTVSAGVRFADLQRALRAHGQFFPADPPFGADTTIGGLLSAAASGALRQRYGPVRDNVLGMRVCLSDGCVAFTGSRVVKSVAGYDIHKLFVGAWGTLGLIGEVTLKAWPLPSLECGVVASFGSCQAANAAAMQLASSALFPLAITLHDRASAHKVRALPGQDAAWTLVVRCGGARAAALACAERAAALVRSCGATHVDPLDADQLHFAWTDIAELAGGSLYPGERWLCMKITCLPAQVADLLAEIGRLLPDAQSTAHPASGVVHTHVPAESKGNALDGFAPLLVSCERERAHVTYLAAPSWLGRRLPAGVASDVPIRLMRGLKAAFDPTGTFDAGRFLAGI